MNSFRNIIAFLLLISLILNPNTQLFRSAFCQSEYELAKDAITSVDEAFKSAYISVIEAEEAGGDVSELVTRFNIGLEYRYYAERALESGEYYRALMLANKALRASEDINDYAILLRQVAVYHEQSIFMSQFLTSLVIGIFTVVFGFLSCRSLKVHHPRKKIEINPEASFDEL